MAKAKTVLFEEQYGVNIKSYSTTDEIDKLVAQRNGLKSLKVELVHPDIISPRGDVFPKIDVDIEALLTEALKY